MVRVGWTCFRLILWHGKKKSGEKMMKCAVFFVILQPDFEIVI